MFLYKLGASELGVALQVGSHQDAVEGQNPLPYPAGRVACDAAQDMDGFLGYSAQCHVMLSFLSITTPKSFWAGMLSIHSLPRLCLCSGLPCLTCRILQLALLSFIRFA